MPVTSGAVTAAMRGEASVKVAISRPMIIWPAIMLAASRRPRVTGRIITLTISMRPMTGARPRGSAVPMSMADLLKGAVLEVANTLANQRGSASVRLNRRWLESLITQGRRPERFTLRSKTKHAPNNHPAPWIFWVFVFFTMLMLREVMSLLRTLIRLVLMNRAGRKRLVMRNTVVQSRVGASLWMVPVPGSNEEKRLDNIVSWGLCRLAKSVAEWLSFSH